MMVKADRDVIENWGQGDECRESAHGHSNPWDTAVLWMDGVEKDGKSEVPRPWGLGGRPG